MSTIGHTSVQLLHWRVYDPVTSLMLHSMTCRAPVSKKTIQKLSINFIIFNIGQQCVCV